MTTIYAFLPPLPLSSLFPIPERYWKEQQSKHKSIQHPQPAAEAERNKNIYPQTPSAQSPPKWLYIPMPFLHAIQSPAALPKEQIKTPHKQRTKRTRPSRVKNTTN